MRVGFVSLALLLVSILPAVARAGAGGAWEGAGTLLVAGGQLGWLPEPGRGCRGFTAEAVFGPGSVGQFSRILADRRLGLCLRFHRSLVRGLVNWQGVELCLRRGFGADPALTPFVELGLGELRIENETAGGGRGSWNAVLGGGLMRSLGSRWTVQLAAQARSVETGGESYSHAALSLTFGGRIDA